MPVADCYPGGYPGRQKLAFSWKNAHKTMMHGHEKSDHAIVAGKPTNKAEGSAAELVERRAGTEGNARQLSTRRTPSRVSVAQDVATAPNCR